ncbi:cAMP-dependent protein kinase catalytic subunit 1 [Nilaparvata lugens]|uniref:cAMP-dependent protein kinase catalytic subunit 1 n=1 Tax=Nilaparvata lugens TaxID=108931 RepID=UPI00193E5D38|nr:cAMP-dependent protein kinase catalytic subunit 1 [Nilaparvata lugens]
MAHKIKRASQVGVSNLKLFLESDKKRFNDFMARKITYKEALTDFEKMQTLGTGSFGRVLLVRHKATNTFYAMKVLNKAKILSLEQVEHTLNEKKILQCLNYPFVVYMAFAFSDNSYLYFVLPFIIGGEMYTLLRKYKTFDEDLAKFYAGQVVLGLEYLHYLDLVYRDLKPENILIDGTGYIKITDFGFCKQLKGRTYTLCGTPEYLAPEIVLSRGYGNAVDWWSFGVLVFEMNAGFPPFQHKDPMVLYDKIAAGRYKVPEHFSIGLRDFVKNMLQVDLSKRFGNLRGGTGDIPYFQNVYLI